MLNSSSLTSLGSDSETAQNSTRLISTKQNVVSRKKGWNQSLEGLRGFSALLVVVTHTYNMALKGGFIAPVANPEIHMRLGEAGPFGVTLFFMISGYLIVQSLIKHQNVKDFYKNRFVRIFPTFFTLHLMIYLLGPIANYDWMGQLKHAPLQWAKSFCINALLLPGVFNFPIAQRNAWSLSFEALFYILAGIGFLAWTNKADNRTKTMWLSAGFLASTATFFFYHPSSLFFAVGATSYFYITKGNVERDRFFWNSPVGLIALVAGFIVWSDVKPNYSGWTSLQAIELALPTIALILGWIAFVSIVGQTGPASALLKLKPIGFLGRISYSLYLVHPFTLHFVRETVRLAGSRSLSGKVWEFPAFVVVGIPLTIYISLLSYNLIEVRLGKWLQGVIVGKDRVS
jgi:peptidoglycan/LPS O-acetylase OafA/YrhL